MCTEVGMCAYRGRYVCVHAEVGMCAYRGRYACVQR